MVQAAKEMMEARRLVLLALKKAHGPNKQQALEQSARLMTYGERMMREAERMLPEKQDTSKAEGFLIEGFAEMIEGKDRLLNALEKEGLSKSSQAIKGEQLLARGAANLLDAKGALEQGEKSSIE